MSSHNIFRFERVYLELIVGALRYYGILMKIHVFLGSFCKIMFRFKVGT